MAYSYAESTASGSTAVFTVPFEYIDKAYIHVSVNGVLVDDALLTWNSSTEVVLPTTPAAGATVRRYRTTPKTPLVTFQSGDLSVLDLNLFATQCLHVVQEATDTGDSVDAALVAVSAAIVSANTATDGATTAAALAEEAATNQVLYDPVAFSAAEGAITTKSSKRNRILNSAHQVCQDRATGATVVITSSSYAFDGVFCSAPGGAGALTCSQVLKTTPGGSPYRARLAVSTADASIAAGDVYGVTFSLEGVDVADLAFGTAAAKSFVWRGVVNMPAGTYGLSFANADTSRSYTKTFTIAPGEANTDKLITAVIPGDTSGTWIKDASSVGIFVRICFATGTNRQTSTLNTWQGGNYWSTSAQTNGMASTSSVFEVADIGLYDGTELPEWEMPSYADDLRKCQRYFWRSAAQVRMFIPSTNASAREVVVQFPVRMRAVPAVTGTASIGTLNPGWIVTVDYMQPEVTGVSTTDAVDIFSLLANARL